MEITIDDRINLAELIGHQAAKVKKAGVWAEVNKLIVGTTEAFMKARDMVHQCTGILLAIGCPRGCTDLDTGECIEGCPP